MTLKDELLGIYPNISNGCKKYSLKSLAGKIIEDNKLPKPYHPKTIINVLSAIMQEFGGYNCKNPVKKLKIKRGKELANFYNRQRNNIIIWEDDGLGDRTLELKKEHGSKYNTNKTIAKILKKEFPKLDKLITATLVRRFCERNKKKWQTPDLKKSPETNWSQKYPSQYFGELPLTYLTFFHLKQFQQLKPKQSRERLAQYLNKKYKLQLTEYKIYQKLLLFKQNVKAGKEEHPDSISNPTLDAYKNQHPTISFKIESKENPCKTNWSRKCFSLEFGELPLIELAACLLENKKYSLTGLTEYLNTRYESQLTKPINKYQLKLRIQQFKQKNTNNFNIHSINWSQKYTYELFGKLPLMYLIYFYSQDSHFQLTTQEQSIKKLTNYLNRQYKLKLTEPILNDTLKLLTQRIKKGKIQHPDSISNPQLEQYRTIRLLEKLIDEE